MLTIVHIIAELVIVREIILVDLASTVILILLATENFVSQPLTFIFEPIPGFWSNNVLIAFPDGPLLPGSFAVAITYSILIYFFLSLISAKQHKKL